MSATWRFRLLLVAASMGLVLTIWLFATKLPVQDAPLADPVAAPESGSNSSSLTPQAVEPGDAARRSLQNGIEYLVARQEADGGWHSDAYGQLRGGAAVSALVLYALSHAPAEALERHEETLRRGMKFLRKGIQPAGFVTNADGSSDYPTYATAMTLVAFDRLGMPVEEALRERMLAYIGAAQLSQEEGWRPADEHFGGWDMVGPAATAGQRITPGTNLSVSSFALESLADTSGPEADAARERAAAWLARCQNLDGDGGFAFSPVADDPANKAGTGAEEERGQGTGDRGESADEEASRLAGQLAARSESAMASINPRSYGTMTTDGLRSLLYAGFARDSAEVRAAAAWLGRNPGLEVVPGFEHLPPEVEWQRGLQFYYFASLAKAGAMLPDVLDASRAQRLAEILIGLQLQDGRWENESSRMREDDPLIATALAVIALGEVERSADQ